MRKSWVLCVLSGDAGLGTSRTGRPSACASGTGGYFCLRAGGGTRHYGGRRMSAFRPKLRPPKRTTGKESAAKTPAADCKTVITKAEFEKLAEALAPNVTPQLKGNSPAFCQAHRHVRRSKEGRARQDSAVLPRL